MFKTCPLFVLTEERRAQWWTGCDLSPDVGAADCSSVWMLRRRAIALAAQDGNQNSFHNTPRTGHCSLHTYPQLLLRWRIERECRSPNSSSHGLCFARPYALRLKDSDHSSHPVGILFENTNSGRRGTRPLLPGWDPQKSDPNLSQKNP